MLIPVNTDAPIYHWPWATLGLIIGNVFTFALTGGGGGVLAPYFILEFGNGLHPEQWVLCNFVHFGWIHLVGNMIFLWGFGIIIEGKLGWWRFLLVYFGIGVLHSAILQMIMAGDAGAVAPQGAGGASGVIFGLLAMAVVWAPKNELSCVLIILYRAVVFDVSILAFAIYYVGLQFFYLLLQVAFWGHVSVSSEVIHLLGAVTGFALGIVMLKQKWVDCENWDLLAVMRGTHGNQADPDAYMYRQKSKNAKKPSNDELPLRPEDMHDPLDEFSRSERKVSHKSRSLRKIRELLEQGRATAALAEYDRMKRIVGESRLDRPALKALADGLYKAHVWEKAVPFMEEYIERFPESADGTRLKLAGVLIEVQHRPRYALRVLATLPEQPLVGKLERERQKMLRIAKRMIAEGVIELDGSAWS